MKSQPMSEAFRRAPVDVRGEWLLRKLRPVYARLPGGASAIVGRGKFDDLDQACDAMDPAAQRAWFGELISIAFPVDENPRANRPDPTIVPVAEFVRRRVRRKFGNNIQSSAMYLEYLRWAEGHGHFAISNKRLSQELCRLGLVQSKSSAIFWLGVEIVADAGAAAAPI